MSVWLTIPSARPVSEVNEVLAKWRGMGYRIAIQRDPGGGEVNADYVKFAPWEGYALACNRLIREVMAMDEDAQWFVLGGDDTEPDPNASAESIAAQCQIEFFQRSREHETFGVMQPTGDRYAGGSIDRIAGSPWIGREFAEKAYGGNGPLWPEYWHMFEDEELREVAVRLGAYWQRPDLVHFHNHFMRATRGINSPAVNKPIPPHLIEANSPAHWNKFKALYEHRKAAGFPGHEVLAEVCT